MPSSLAACAALVSPGSGDRRQRPRGGEDRNAHERAKTLHFVHVIGGVPQLRPPGSSSKPCPVIRLVCPIPPCPAVAREVWVRFDARQRTESQW